MRKTITMLAAAAVLTFGLAAPALADWFDPGAELGYVDRETLERAFGRAGYDHDDDAGDVQVWYRYTERGTVYCSNKTSRIIQVSEITEVNSFPDNSGMALDGFGDDLGSRGFIPEEGDRCPWVRRSSETVTGIVYEYSTGELGATWNGLKHGLDDSGGNQQEE